MNDGLKQLLMLIGILLAIIAGLIVALIALATSEANDWDEFSHQHQCKIVGHIKGDMFNTYSTNSKGNISVGIATTSDKTGWLCDDGITYYR